MDKPIIQLTNYIPHPENPEYAVFIYYKIEQADYFEELLLVENIKFERFFDEDNDPPRTLFAIRRSKLNTVLPLNFKALGKYRQRTIKNPFWYWFVYVFVGFLLVIALIGYFS